MKKYLLDTNICIYILRNFPQVVKENLKSNKDDKIYISHFTIAELLVGIEKGKFTRTQIEATHKLISTFEAIHFETKEAEMYAKIRANLEKNGSIIGAMDMLIASVAVTNDLIIVTNNEKEFKRVPNLKIENWAK